MLYLIIYHYAINNINTTATSYSTTNYIVVLLTKLSAIHEIALIFYVKNVILYKYILLSIIVVAFLLRDFTIALLIIICNY